MREKNLKLFFNLSKVKTNKGQMGIQSIGMIALAILVAAVVLGLGGTILNSIQDSQTDAVSTIPNNQSLTWAGNDTAIPLNEGRAIVGTEKVWNESTLLTRGTHYDMDSGAITFTNDTDPGIDLSTDALNTTYNYNYGSAAYNSSGFGISGTITMAQFIPTIAIVVVAAIVIGIILVFFGRRE